MTLNILRDNSDKRPSDTRKPIASFVLRNSLSSVLPPLLVLPAFFFAVIASYGEKRPTRQAHRKDGARKVRRTQSPSLHGLHAFEIRAGPRVPVNSHLDGVLSLFPLTEIPVVSHLDPHRTLCSLTLVPARPHQDPRKTSPQSALGLTGIGLPDFQGLQSFKVFTYSNSQRHRAGVLIYKHPDSKTPIAHPFEGI